MTMKKTYKGIDVSTHNGVIDWGAASKEVDFAIIRCGYGRGGEDAQFKNNAESCKAYNIPFGVYYFSYATTPAEAIVEAKRAIEMCRDYEPSLGIAYDFEDDSIRYAKAQGKNLDKETIRKMASAFLDTIANESDFNPILYASKSFYQKYYEGLPYYFWLAQWGTKEPGLKCDMWQYSNIGKVGGIFGFVDVNYTDYLKSNEDVIEFGDNDSLNTVLNYYKNKYLHAAGNVIKGMYGNGEDRKARLKSLGYDAEFVQNLVNCLVK